ncbi:hypothetical protein H8356DRAFT_1329574 [Neocallimastix lanati (nom. inval.)]|nr:hypothetical protein H8356DRAFT_1329574 [Neocallimastix sp. JGI-2020a]
MAEDEDMLIIWVSLPKELAFIVGYYESIGYILVLTDNSDNNKVCIKFGSFITLAIVAIFATYVWLSFPPMNIAIPLNSVLIDISNVLGKDISNDKYLDMQESIYHLR